MYDTKSSVCWTRLLNGGQDLLVCSMDGSIQIFDIRRETRRKQHFDGHDNSHTVLRGCVDDQERFLFAGGQDGIMRAWSLRTSHLLMANKSLISERVGTPRVLSWLPEGPSLVIGTENGAFAMDVAGSVNE
jgi:WD40 repeat protein